MLRRKIAGNPLTPSTGIVLDVLGLPGLLDDVPAWGGLMSFLGPGASGVLVGAGLILIFFWLLAKIDEWREIKNIREKRHSPASADDEMPRAPFAPRRIPPEDTITPHGILSMGRTGYPERLTTWEDMKDGVLAPPPAGPPSDFGEGSPIEGPDVGPAPMRGIPELERCRKAFVKYTSIPASLSHLTARISGSAELYPYMTDLCRVLDEERIPHPEIDWDATTIVNTGRWSRFLGDLWAVRHDLEAARRVYQEDSRS